ncbi:magnesium transporter [Anaerotignum sp. MSJ-24]|uniref:magnesium transporter n=1 Tax=Anaerotignum sp. MSJ-24 TaxID=2841521 RepID=UPI002ED1B098
MLEDEKKKNDPNSEIPERPDYEKELEAIIKSNLSDDEIREKLSDYHENDIADVLEDLTEEERQKLYRILGVESVSEIFAYLEDEVGKYINELDSEKAADIIESMDADDAVDILDELEDDKSDEIKKLMDEDARQDIDLILSYDDDQIGSRMTTNFIAVKKNSTVRQAMKSLINQAAENDNISTIYVVNDDDTFYGAVDLKDLIIARDYQDFETLISTSYPYVYAEEKTGECIEELKDYSEDSIPVLSNDNKILGVITAQDLVEAVDEEMGDDYAKLAGLTAEEDLNEPFKDSVKKRLPWLLLLLVLGLVVSSVVSIFEGVVQQITLVVAFQSLILDMAGNVGTQSLAVTIRVIMDEALSKKDERKLIFKEMRVGFTNGMILGVLAFVAIGVYILVFKGKSVPFSFSVSGCIGISLLFAMVVSSLVGTVVPLFFKKINIDPAVASGPLITTVNDLVAVVSYYGIVWILLINILQLVE